MILQISASAGSGKTYALTRRFLALLNTASPSPLATGCALFGGNQGYSLAEILAATFTNKAAAEMRDRVLSTLKEEALAEIAQGKAGKAHLWVERILRHYGSLNIRTIDSLLTTLVRLSALELRLPPDFAPCFEPAEYFTPLYDALMEDLAADGIFSREFTRQLAESLGDEDFSGQSAAAGEPAPASPPFLTTDGAALRARLAEACRSLLFLSEFKGFSLKGRLHNRVLDLVERLLRGESAPVMDPGALHARLNALHAEVTEACAVLLAVMEKEELSAQANFRNFLGRVVASSAYRPLPDSVYLKKARLDDCLNKASKGLASEWALRAFARASAALAAFSIALPLLRHALELAPLTALAHEVHSRMQSEGNERLLPAPRLPGLAAALLSGEHGVSDALCRMGTRLSRLLLDEFQDTSRDQWAAIMPLALESLSTGGDLTYVGDVKQAIYGWRGGDARLFDQALHEAELAAVAPDSQKQSLPCNWRSHPAIVRHNNAFFSLLENESVARTVLSAMLPSGTPEALCREAGLEAARIFSGCRQEIPPQKHWEEDPKSLLAEVRLYHAEAPKVEDLEVLVRRRLKTLFLDELVPSWRFGDIAVLVRTGEEAARVAAWLTDWGLPVVTENSFLLAEHPLVHRLISFLTFLDYPLDDLAFWEFAGGPECLGRGAFSGLADPDAWLAAQCLDHAPSGARGNTPRPPLYTLFRRDFPAIWESHIAPFYSEAGLMSAYDTLLETVRRFRLMERMPEQAPFIRRLLEVAHLAESRGHSSLAAFLAFWREGKEREKLPLPESMDAVRVMTMHKAKGLEFPVVVLPFQHRGGRRDREIVAVNFLGLDLLTRNVPELGEPYYRACVTDELERLNLLYVAWTRPVYALHAFITRPASRPTPLTRALEILISAYKDGEGDGLCRWERLEPVPPGAGEIGPIAPRPSTPGEDLPDSLAHAPLLEPCPGADRPAPPSEPWRPMSWLPRLKIYRSPLRAPHFSPRQRGIFAHLCLEHLHLAPDQDAEAIRLDVERAVRQGLRLFPLPLEDPERAAEEMRAALFWFARLPEAPHWLAYGLREQGIMDAEGRLHRVDLLVDERTMPGQGDDAPLLALDYKTGRQPRSGSGSHGGPEEHQSQVRRYMRLTAAATGRSARGVLVYLDEQRLEEVPLEEDRP